MYILVVFCSDTIVVPLFNYLYSAYILELSYKFSQKGSREDLRNYGPITIYLYWMEPTFITYIYSNNWPSTFTGESS